MWSISIVNQFISPYGKQWGLMIGREYDQWEKIEVMLEEGDWIHC